MADLPRWWVDGPETTLTNTLILMGLPIPEMIQEKKGKATTIRLDRT